MTKTIEEITRKFYEVIYNYSDDEHKDYWHLVTRNIDGEDDPSWELKTEYKEKMQKELEKTVCSFADNSDDFAAAFAAFITCVIRYNLCDDDESYEDVLSEAADRLLPSGMEDSEKLKQFLKDFSRKVCENDYDTITDLCNDYDYSIVLLYAFGRYVFLYSFKNGEDPESDEEIHEILAELYDNMPDDMREYVFHKNIYAGRLYNPAASDYLLPFIYHSSKAELDMGAISSWWKIIADNPDDIDICQTYWGLIYDKLNQRLNKESSEDDEDNDDWNSKTPEIIDSIAAKNDMLHIPVIIHNLDTFENELKKSIALEKARDEKNEIVNRFSHRYKNMKATSLQNVAEALLKMESKDLKKYGRTILLEYGIKKALTKEVEILQLYFEDDIKKLRNKVQNSVNQTTDENYSISDIINESIKRCMNTIVHDGSDEAKKIRKACLKNYNLISIRDDFEQGILFSENCDVINWFSQNIVKLHVSVSELWKKIFFQKSEYADNIISSLLVDLIMNAIKYADKTKPVIIEFTSNHDFMLINSKNTIVGNKDNIPGSGNGLKNQNDLLQKLNKVNDKQYGQAISTNEYNGIFTITINISKDLFRSDRDVI